MCFCCAMVSARCWARARSICWWCRSGGREDEDAVWGEACRHITTAQSALLLPHLLEAVARPLLCRQLLLDLRQRLRQGAQLALEDGLLVGGSVELSTEDRPDKAIQGPAQKDRTAWLSRSLMRFSVSVTSRPICSSCAPSTCWCAIPATHSISGCCWRCWCSPFRSILSRARSSGCRYR